MHSIQLVGSRTNAQGRLLWTVNTSYPVTQMRMTTEELGQYTNVRESFHVARENESVLGIAKIYGILPNELVGKNLHLTDISTRVRFKANTILYLPVGSKPCVRV